MADKDNTVSYDQNPSDVLRLLVGLVLFLFFGLISRGTVPTLFETDLFRLINHLPALASVPLQAGMQLGSLAAVVILRSSRWLSGAGVWRLILSSAARLLGCWSRD